MNGDHGMREEIKSLLPFLGVSLERARAAVEYLPSSELLRYRNELRDAARAAGLAHELRLLGELLQRRSTDFDCRPFDSSTRCDALLVAACVEIELEVTAIVAPAVNAAIARVCRRVEDHLRDRFPGLFFRVGLSNLLYEFPKEANGSIDEEALYPACVRDLKRAIDYKGVPDRDWMQQPGGPVADVSMSGYMACSQTGFSVPGPAVIEQGAPESDVEDREPPSHGGAPLDTSGHPRQLAVARSARS